MLETIETAIIDALKPIFDKFQIESFPADFDSYNFTSAKGCMLVRYDGSIYSKPQTINLVTQDETLEFSVITGLRSLKKYKDAYPILKQVKDTLTGLVINGKKLYPVKKAFLEKITKDLYWGVSFAITLPTQEVSKESNVVPLWQ
ncbi:MAG: Gp37 family protein [Candidatus Gastranaerophilales bacterium]|nr:Gp37 family protein [Candidatus Gastranaerophilales bacterium]